MVRFNRWLFAFLLVSMLASLIACGSSDDSDPVAPSGLVLTIEESSLWVNSQTGIEASLVYPRSEAPVCDWYVDGILGGSVDLGTITQDNPAVYTAPAAVPAAGEVEISAVWSDDESIEGVGTLDIKMPEVHIALPETGIQITETLEINATLEESDREDPQFEWYVDDVLGGNATVGTITQTTPATYTAPGDVPVGGAVEIKARWVGNPEFYHASANLTLLFTIKHVNAATGVDEPEGGRITEPFKTITYALEQNYAHGTHGDTILVAPGTYGPAIGDDFMINISWATVLRGVDRGTCIIDVNPDENSLFWIDSGSTIEHFTVRNLEYPDSDVNLCITIQGTSTVRDIQFTEPYNSAAIRVTNWNVVGHIEDCILQNTLEPGVHRGIELTNHAQGVIRDCTIKGWGYGVMVTTGDEVAPHLIEGCDIKSNLRGVMLSTAGSQMDLGGGSEGSLGGNIIQNNDIGVYSQSEYDTYALYNTWGEYPPVECEFEADAPCDFYENNTGSIIWEE